MLKSGGGGGDDIEIWGVIPPKHTLYTISTSLYVPFLNKILNSKPKKGPLAHN